MSEQINGKSPEFPEQQAPAEPEQKITPAEQAMVRVLRFKSVLARWQLGSGHEQGDPQFDAVCDQRALLMILRTEMNALLTLLVDTRIIKHTDFQRGLEAAANQECTQLSLRFPGYYGMDEGLGVDTRVAESTIKKYKLDESR